ncbi:MAG: hypothetical protein GF347_04215 [Candidatus Moranbacteria bacterium]|nr:hypothetical protein [Candidatus Moranbacteria bacterium]
MKNILIYIKERFPILPALIYCVLFILTIFDFFQNYNPINIFLLTVSLFLFLFSIRLQDEIKDYQYDNQKHRERPLQRGIISLEAIKNLLLITIIIQVSIQAVFFFEYFRIFLIIAFYNLMIFKEFFIKKFLDNHIFIYLISHQFIFFLIIYYFMQIASHKNLEFNRTAVLFSISLFFVPLLWEIGRKIKHRYSSNNAPTDDTYVYYLGRKKAFAFLILLFIAQTLLILSYKQQYTFPLALYFGAIISIIAVYLQKPKPIYNQSPNWSAGLSLFSLIVMLS